MTKVVILAGGMGTRLREETEIKPKPMVEIGGRPILWHIMKHLCARYGFKDFVICLGYQGEVIKRLFPGLRRPVSGLDESNWAPARSKFTAPVTRDDWRVTLVDTGEETHDWRPGEAAAEIRSLTRRSW